MRVVMFYHSLVSDWNHGNAHFLRGISWQLRQRGHDVRIFEPRNGWSYSNLIHEHGRNPVRKFYQAYPGLRSFRYSLKTLDVHEVLRGADLVLVHEWNDPELVGMIGEHRSGAGKYRLLFHDTHHRSVTDPESMARFDLSNYDGVLAFGNVIRDLYIDRGWCRFAWTWHEAADTRVFSPIGAGCCKGDVVWIGNWGDDERTAEIHEFLIEPVKRLGLTGTVYGVRYPRAALKALQSAGIEYGGWLANFDVPKVFSRYKLTIHIPRRPYVKALPGIPTIRPFEAMACEIPLISSPWLDAEGLFDGERDYLTVSNGSEMTKAMTWVLENESLARRMVRHARRNIAARHTCTHRVEQLMEICKELGLEVGARKTAMIRGAGYGQ